MTKKLDRVRRLGIDAEAAYLWSVRHRHTRTADTVTDCRLVLSLQREGTRQRLEITFRAAPGRIVSTGYWESGTVVSHDSWLNLYEPGVVRRLLDTAAARGTMPARAGTAEVDGWPLFDAVTAAGPKAPAD
jgi:hypothetical protein